MLICKSFIMLPLVRENLHNNDNGVCHPPTYKTRHDKLLTNCLIHTNANAILI